MIFSRKRKSERVFCEGCAHLFLVKGIKYPMCVATAKFVEGPLRSKIDVKGVTAAEARNIRNDCTYKTVISKQAWEFKRWLVRRFKHDDKEQFKEIELRLYPIQEEYKQKKAILDRQEKTTNTEEKETDGNIDYKSGEEKDLRDIGGIVNNDESSSPGEVEPESIQDAGDSG
jgi:hypothetical protein